MSLSATQPQTALQRGCKVNTDALVTESNAAVSGTYTVCVCVCVRACVRACVCVHACVFNMVIV